MKTKYIKLEYNCKAGFEEEYLKEIIVSINHSTMFGYCEGKFEEIKPEIKKVKVFDKTKFNDMWIQILDVLKRNNYKIEDMPFMEELYEKQLKDYTKFEKEK